jgi:hypothetical protein
MVHFRAAQGLDRLTVMRNMLPRPSGVPGWKSRLWTYVSDVVEAEPADRRVLADGPGWNVGLCHRRHRVTSEWLQWYPRFDLQTDTTCGPFLYFFAIRMHTVPCMHRSQISPNLTVKPCIVLINQYSNPKYSERLDLT